MASRHRDAPTTSVRAHSKARQRMAHLGKTWRRDPTANLDISDGYASSSKEANHQRFRKAITPAFWGECLREALKAALRNKEEFITPEKIDRIVGKLHEMHDLLHSANTCFYSATLHRSVKLDELVAPHVFRELFWWASMPRSLDNVLKNDWAVEDPTTLLTDLDPDLYIGDGFVDLGNGLREGRAHTKVKILADWLVQFGDENPEALTSMLLGQDAFRFLARGNGGFNCHGLLV